MSQKQGGDAGLEVLVLGSISQLAQGDAPLALWSAGALPFLSAITWEINGEVVLPLPHCSSGSSLNTVCRNSRGFCL